CWVHKTANVLNKVALSVQVNMKVDLREIYGAPTRAAAEAAIDVFANKYGAKYDKAVACLTKDREALLAFFDFPAEHWDHLRTSNPIESVFATVRHRTVRTKGALSAKTAKLMVFKLVNAAAKTWRRLKGENQLPKVVQGVSSRPISCSAKTSKSGLDDAFLTHCRAPTVAVLLQTQWLVSKSYSKPLSLTRRKSHFSTIFQ